MGTTLASAAEIAKILKCPPNVIPVVGFSLGYANEKPLVRDRLPIKGIVHRDVYRTPSAQALRDTYREKEQTGMKRYRENSELKKRIDEVGAENLAQVYTKAKYTRESHLKYSKDLFNFLKDQNFLNFE